VKKELDSESRSIGLPASLLPKSNICEFLDLTLESSELSS